MSDAAKLEENSAGEQTAGRAGRGCHRPTERHGLLRTCCLLVVPSLALLCGLSPPRPSAQTQPAAGPAARPAVGPATGPAARPAAGTSPTIPAAAATSQAGASRPPPVALVEQIAQLVAPDAKADQGFGSAVAISGDTIVVGAPRASGEDNLRGGRVYIYGPTGAGWELQQTLASPDPQANERFGESVAILNNVLVINAPHHRVKSTWGRYHEGQVYVFVRNGKTWRLQAALHELLLARNTVAAVGDVRYPFGRIFALTNSSIVVSPRSNAEKLHSFSWNGSLWNYEGQLSHDSIHICLSVYEGMYASDGNKIAIGPCLRTTRYGDDNRDQFEYEEAHLLQRKEGVWQKETALSRIYDWKEPQDDFAISVAVSGDTVAAGAPKPLQDGTSKPGEVEVHVRAGSKWTEQAVLGANPRRAGDQFGRWLALSGDRLVVGSRDPYLGQATVHFFFRRSGAWQLVSMHDQDSPDASLYLRRGEPPAPPAAGLPLAIAGDLVVIGAAAGKASANALPERALIFRFRGAP